MKKIIKYFIIITIIVVSALILIYYSFAMRHIYDTNIIELGDECYWYDAGREEIVPRRGRIIPPVVQNYSYNKDYIIAKQQPRALKESASYCAEYEYKLGRDTTYYWIIIKNDSTTIGPLLYDEFRQLLEEYDIELTLDD